MITSCVNAIGSVVRLCQPADRKSTRLNSSHMSISYAVFCLKKKKDQMPESIAAQMRQLFPMLVGWLIYVAGLFFFLNAPTTTEIYTLSLHDALPIWAAPAAASTPTVVTLGFDDGTVDQFDN